MKKFIKFAVFPLLLSGCLATPNLVVDGSTLSEDDRAVVITIAAEMTTRCTRVQYRDQVGTEVTNRVPITSNIQIKRLFSSSEGWYRAEAWSSGVIDNVYYNKGTKRFVCGQRYWDTFSEANRIIFSEVGVVKPSLNSVPSGPSKIQPARLPSPSLVTSDAAVSPLEQRLTELKALFDKGLISKDQYEQKRSDLLKSL